VVSGVRRVGLVLGALAGLVALPAGVGAAPVAAQDDPVVYVSLGDSYTSGPLVLPHDTTWVPQDCGQSARNFAHLAALQVGVDVFRDASCGSATIDDLAEAQDGLPLGGVNRPQLDALGSEVDVVTVGLGGNDVGFTGVAAGCFRLATEAPLGRPPCHHALLAGGVDRVSAEIQGTRAELVAGLRAVQARAPHAAVLVVSYPTSLPDDGLACWPYVPILQADMPHLVRWFKEMNAMLRAAALEAGATYVDIYTPSIGHDACQLPPFAWVNGMVLVPPSYPAHPNDLGYLGTAPTVARAIRAALAQQAAGHGAPSPTEAARDLPGAGGGAAAESTPVASRRRGRLPATGTATAMQLTAGSAALAVALGALRLGRRARPV
jgi:lysophospholipase L1-like esterase